MKIDVVIPVYKPGKDFITLIRRLKEQTLKPSNIFVINTQKEIFDAFLKENSISEEDLGIELSHVTSAEYDHAATRHMGMEKSDADVVVMMTQDAVPLNEHLLENLVKNLSENVAVCYARQISREDAGLLEVVTREFNYPEKSQIRTKEDIDTLGVRAFFSSDVCAAYRRDIYYKTGGFQIPAIFNEDTIYAFNALMKGYGVAYEAEAKVIHSHHYSCMQQFKRNFDIGVSQAQHPEVFAKYNSESEGKKLVKAAFKKFFELKKPLMFIPFCFQCGFKLLGYRTGKKYKNLSKAMVLKCTSNKNYWLRGE